MYGQDYPERLKAAGFTVEVIDYNERLSPELFAKYALPEREKLFVCSKV
jgi:hypothetical protein